MASDSSDLLMKFELPTGKQVEAESSTDLSSTKSALKKGFKSGCIMDVDSFSLRIGIGGEDADAAQQRIAHEATQTLVKNVNDAFAKLQEQSEDASETGIPKPKPRTIGQFSKFRRGVESKYPVDMQPVEFTRGLDKASTVLMQGCIARTNFRLATLIKRRAAGGPQSGEPFLRFDFEDVLIVRVDWDEDDPIKEKFKFIARTITMHYTPQLPDGSHGPAIQRWWSMSDLRTRGYSLSG